MIRDTLTTFCDAESVAMAAGNTVVGDVIDLGAVSRNIGMSRQMYLVLVCTTSIITAGGAGTIKFTLESDSTADLATSATTHWDSGTFVTDGDDANALDAGDLIAVVALPMGNVSEYERYLGIRATVATQEVTAGAIDAFLTLDPYGWAAYPEGNN